MADHEGKEVKHRQKDCIFMRKIISIIWHLSIGNLPFYCTTFVQIDPNTLLQVPIWTLAGRVVGRPATRVCASSIGWLRPMPLNCVKSRQQI